jgi:hypothetical protein
VAPRPPDARTASVIYPSKSGSTANAAPSISFPPRYRGQGRHGDVSWPGAIMIVFIDSDRVLHSFAERA